METWNMRAKRVDFERQIRYHVRFVPCRYALRHTVQRGHEDGLSLPLAEDEDDIVRLSRDMTSVHTTLGVESFKCSTLGCRLCMPPRPSKELELRDRSAVRVGVLERGPDLLCCIMVRE